MAARFGDFTFDPDRRQILRGDQPIHLTRKAFELLMLLIQAAPRVVHKNEIHQRLWPSTFVSEATLASTHREDGRCGVTAKAGPPRPPYSIERNGKPFTSPMS
jgi:DNA-binding response OmpR family regulator